MSGGGGNILKVAAPLALGLMLPGVGTALAPALAGMGMEAGAAAIGSQALMGAGIGGLGSALTGGNVGKGALLGGIGGGITGGLGNAFPETFDAANAATSATAGSPFAYSASAGLNPADTQHIAGMFDNVPSSLTGVSTVAAPAATTGGIGDLLSSKYALPILGGAASLLASGEKQKSTLSRNDLPAHNVAAMQRTSMPVDQSVYYGTGGGNRRYLSDTPEVVFAAEGGSISSSANNTNQEKEIRPSYPAYTKARNLPDGIYTSDGRGRPLTPLNWKPKSEQSNNAASVPMQDPSLQRVYQPVNPSVYYGVGGMRDNFVPAVQQSDSLTGVSTVPVPKFKKGGGIGHLIQGAGDGTSDDIPAMLSDGEYVIPSAVVSALGNGSNKAGAKKLDGFKKTVLKKHYKSAKAPKSMGIGSYMQGMAA